VTPNVRVDQQVKFESGLREPQTPVDLSEMTVDTLAPGVFMVGQGDYSLFVEDDGGYIAVNMYAGLKDRYEALVEKIDSPLPLRDAIVTHHHSDHMDGISEAHELGATLHVTPETLKVINASEEFPATLSTTVIQNGEMIGALQVYIRATSHSVENAFVYHPDTKVLFQDDHYHGLLEDGPTRIQPSALIMYESIRALGLPVERLLSGHARKAEPWSEFETAIATAGDTCPSKRAICKDQIGQ